MKRLSIFFAAFSVFAQLGCTQTPTLRAVQVTRGAVETTVATISSGTVEAEEQADLNFGAMGRVAEIKVDAGAKVKKGDVLAALENADLAAVARDANQDARRVESLFKEGLISRTGLDEARRAARVAQSNYEKSLIVAPFSGLVTSVNLRKGELAQLPAPPDRPPIRLIDLKARLIKGEIDELDVGRVKIGLSARVRVPALNQNFLATVSSSVPFVSSTREQDRTSEIELRLNESDPRIPVGASAEVEIVTESKTDAVIVPARTVMGTISQRYVYKFDGSRVHKVLVEVGIGNYEVREIVKGIVEGDTVVFPTDEVEMKDNLKVKVDLQKWP